MKNNNNELMKLSNEILIYRSKFLNHINHMTINILQMDYKILKYFNRMILMTK